MGLTPDKRPVFSNIKAKRVSDIALTAILWFACATLTMQLTRFGGGISIVWLAGPFLFATLASVPKRYWLALTLGCLPPAIGASAIFGIGGFASIPIGMISLAEAYAAAWLSRRFSPRYVKFASVADVGWFLLAAGLLVPAASATLAAPFAQLAAGAPYWAAWRDWFTGHSLGLIAFGPPLVFAQRGELQRRLFARGRRRALEIGLMLAAVAVASLAAFLQSAIPLVMLPIVPMLACAFRLGRAGAVSSILIFVVIAMSCSLLGLGPTVLLNGNMTFKFQVLQIYIAMTVVTLLPVAAELSMRHRLTERLRAAEELHRLILERSGDVVLRCDRTGRACYVSPMVTSEWGYAPEEIIGKVILDFMRAEDRAAHKMARERALDNPDQTAIVEYRIQPRKGGIIWVESHIRAVLDRDGYVAGTISIIREITQRRMLVEELAYRASIDPLTGLLNRRAYQEALALRLQEAAHTHEEGCLALFDLDHFKSINDRYGHAAGDQVLQHFAKIVRSAVREGDITARLGGEEFVVVLNDASVDDARKICERIRLEFGRQEHRISSDVKMQATVSVGIAPLKHGVNPSVFHAAADEALYRAKAAGRDRLCLSSDCSC
ncbi:diguanylate cyclase [Sphingomonas sp.]|uniref:sensor domain-containing diguanylate cyclase n=1 Tax=Sphingomonas sp. TaxID=28214 RepID=UPI003B3A6E85